MPSSHIMEILKIRSREIYDMNLLATKFFENKNKLESVYELVNMLHDLQRLKLNIIG